ncbi:DUF3558 domain-containing protein [Mycobacteroides abscessus subsp. abscessus]|uniref:DUF3558 domain-containing protein n=1 Tax=Mycobacteroides immunogenum TaxID=83262 RepID=A0ABR5LJU0_9MYCO|nr:MULTISPECIES: DUF3558 domain-containing protein [Mycobacteroides]MDM2402672.1 DUF3558 domain-containing protein [Mycobacteroides abscessus]KPG25086.1 hypothetical protein AN912_27755 [Mycobacteroides immunogenum]KPG29277.1 hypothetical protein AN913_11340 [Mycobacteroides immunogenum]KPG56442.1 hypothetical protein AN918_27620 [Mycobacteroides immunogenum]MDM2412981.1 DUF3558 domain-containing protein [Mycobacteroides abscessus]
MMRIGLACAATLLTAGCSTSTGITKPADVTGSPSPSASSTASAQPQVSSTLTAPHPPPNHWNDGTSYDPCLTYTAEQIRAWGVDPAKVSDVGAEDRQLRGCRWSADGWSVEVSVANSKVSSYLDAELFDNPRSITVAGLQAVQYDGGNQQAPACTVVLPSQSSVVGVLVVIVDPKRAKGVSDPCSKATEVATAVAPTLPK